MEIKYKGFSIKPSECSDGDGWYATSVEVGSPSEGGEVGPVATKEKAIDMSKKEIDKLLESKKDDATADGPTNSGMRWPISAAQILADADIKCENGMISEADFNRAIEILEPHVATAEKEKIVKDDMNIDWLWARVGTDQSGTFALEKWLTHVDKGAATTLKEMKETLESFQSDINEFCMPLVQDMLDEIELIESGIEDDDIELVDEE